MTPSDAHEYDEWSAALECRYRELKEEIECIRVEREALLERIRQSNVSEISVLNEPEPYVNKRMRRAVMDTDAKNKDSMANAKRGPRVLPSARKVGSKRAVKLTKVRL